MAQKNETLPLILALLVTGGILGAGWWWFNRKSGTNTPVNSPVALSDNSNTATSELPSSPKTNSNNNNQAQFGYPSNIPPGTTIEVNGSTSMVQINQGLKRGFETTFVGTTISTNAQGTGVGLQLLQAGEIDISAISRPLTDAEKAQGLNAVPIAKDAIAIVVGVNNPFRRGLSSEQVTNIFQGNLTNWSELGSTPSTIRVINRPAFSGTHQIFQKVVLNDTGFGTDNNFTTLDRDATTPILRMLGTDGISYATYAQVANQRTVRTVAVDGLTPEANNYPYSRVLYYAYQEPASPEVAAFLGYVRSPQGQAALFATP